MSRKEIRSNQYRFRLGRPIIVRQLSPQDAFMYYRESPKAPYNITFVNIYDRSTITGERLTFDRIQRGMQDRLHLAKAFRQKLVPVAFNLDHPYWVEDANFNIEFHLRHLALPRPGDWREFCGLAARLASIPLDLTRPPWEMYVIDGLSEIKGIPPDAFAIIMKVHHTVIDGVAGMEMLSAISETSPDAVPRPPAQEWTGEPDPSAVGQLVRGVAHLAQRPASLLGIRKLVGPLAKNARRELTSPQPVPRTRFNASASGHRVFDARWWPFEQVRSVRALVPGATVNDAVMAVISGAIRRYLQAKNELPQSSMFAFLPMSVRSEKAGENGGNEVVQLTVRLHTEVADPVERFRRICASAVDSKKQINAIGARTLTELAAILPGALVGSAYRAQLAVASRAPAMANLFISNVPGPTVPLYFMGAQQIRLMGISPLVSGIGLAHIVGTYNGEFIICFTADRDVMPDPDFYAECIEQSLAELLAAVSQLPPTTP